MLTLMSLVFSLDILELMPLGISGFVLLLLLMLMSRVLSLPYAYAYAQVRTA